MKIVHLCSMKLFNLAFISVFPAHNLQTRNPYGSNPLRASSLTNVVNLNVGGVKYSLFDEDIRKHPGSFFEKAQEDREGPANMEVNVLRDGNLFKFVNGYILTGHLPSNLDAETIAQVEDEADFYGLPALKAECAGAGVATEGAVTGGISLFSCVALRATTVPLREAEQLYPIPLVDYESPLLGALRQCLAPCYFIDNNIIYKSRWEDSLKDRQLFKSSTFDKLNVTELIAVAKHLAKNSNAPKNTFEIHPILLCADAVEKLSTRMKVWGMLGLSYDTPVVWQASKLLVQTTESGPYAHTSSVRREKYVGTVHAVLNSTFEGGEVIVSSGDQRASLHVSNLQWIAVHGDCTHSVAPVTTGSRVSLIYDIYIPDGEPKLNNDHVSFLHSSSEYSNPESLSLSRCADLVPLEAQKLLFNALNAELRGVDCVDVALRQHYPACHHTPFSALRGSDRTLYDLLSKQYDVQVVAMTIRNEYIDISHPGLYFPPGILPDAKLGVKDKSKLFLPHQLTQQHVVDEYSPDIEDRGYLYLLSALRVRKKLA